MNFECILLSVTDTIATITLNRPDKLNALNAQLLRELDTAFRDLQTNAELRCVIVTGAGPKAFAAGADIAELQQCTAQTGSTLAEYGQSIFQLIEDFPVPVIAAVNGFALGGGCELAMACHFRYASPNAQFGQPESKLGIIPGYGGTQRLSRLCGPAIATELICTGIMMNAERALHCGLVNAIVPAEELLETCMKAARSIRSMAPLAIRAALRAIRAHELGDGMDVEAREFGDLCGTADFREGTAAFLEKRAAAFQGH